MNYPLWQLLDQLDAAGLSYTLGRYRADTVLVSVTLVGERVEIDVFDDGRMEVSRFKGDEGILGGAELIEEIIAADKA